MTDLVPEVGWGVALLAGLASFFSPCVAPLVPGYLSYVAGTSPGGTGKSSLHVLGATLLFILGFTFVFVLLGASAGLLGGFLDAYRRPLNRAAGLVMIVMGLVLLGVGPMLLKRDTRFQLRGEVFGPAGPVILGMAFGFGWTPCIGPILASILFYAGLTETAGRAALLLAVYSLGLGIPFVIVGLGLNRAIEGWQVVRRWSGALSWASGLTMIVLGLLFLTERAFYVNLAVQRMTSLWTGGRLIVG